MKIKALARIRDGLKQTIKQCEKDQSLISSTSGWNQSILLLDIAESH